MSRVLDWSGPLGGRTVGARTRRLTVADVARAFGLDEGMLERWLGDWAGLCHHDPRATQTRFGVVVWCTRCPAQATATWGQALPVLPPWRVR